MLASTVCKILSLNARGLKKINKSEEASLLILRIKNVTAETYSEQKGELI